MVVIFTLLFLVGFVLMRKTLLPGMLAFACLPMGAWMFNCDNFTVALLTILVALILFAHRRNLTEEFAVLAARGGGHQT
jgi:uncharacterized membrane protein YhfC